MALFRNSKSSNLSNNLAHQPPQDDGHVTIRISSEGSSALSSFSTYTPARANQRHPTHHHFPSSSYSGNCALPSPHPPQSAPHLSPSPLRLNRSRSLFGLNPSSPYYSPNQPHQPKRTLHSRLLTSMASHVSGYPTPISSSTASAPSTFRLLKSKIFPSAPPKPKPTHSPRLNTAPSNLPRNMYLFPGSTSSSEHMDYVCQASNPEQKVYLIRQRSKSNNMINRHQEFEMRKPNQLPSPPPHPASGGLSVDFRRAGSSFELSRVEHSIDLSRGAPSIDLQRVAPVNHHPLLANNRVVVVDLNSNRMNYPSFNNKPVAQNGPRVLRLVGQASNSQFDNLSSQVVSHRPTPIPHGGSGAILTLNSVRPAALPRNFRHPDPYHEPVPTRLESLPLNNQHLGSSSTEDHDNETTSPSRETLHITGVSTAPLRSHHSFGQLTTSTEKNDVTYDLLQDVVPDVTLQLPSSSSTFLIKNLDTSISTLASNTAVSPTAAKSQLATVNKTVSPKSNASSDSTAASNQSIELDFSEFANFLSYPDLGTLTPHNEPSQSELIIARHPSLPSLFSSKPPSTPKSYLSPITPRVSSQHVSSLPSTPAPAKLHSASSLWSLRAHGSSQFTAKAEFTSPLPLSSSSTMPSPVSPIPYPQSTVNAAHSAAITSPSARPDLYSVTSSHSSSPLSPFGGRVAPFKQVPPPLPLPQPPLKNPTSNSELVKARKIIVGLQNEVKQLKDATTDVAVSEPSNVNLSSSMPSSESQSTAAPSSTTELNIATENENPSLEPLGDNDDNASPSLKILRSGFIKKLERSSVVIARGGPSALPKDDISKSDSQFQSDDELEHTTKPSRLPIAKYRLREVASVQFLRNLHSRTASGASITSRTCRVSLGSNGSTEYRCATSQSHTTYRTTPSPISTSLKSKPRQASSRNPVLSELSRSQSLQGEEAWSRSTQDVIYPDFGEGGSQVSRTSKRSSKKDTRRHIPRASHTSRAPSIASHSSSSSGQPARAHVGAPQSRRHHGPLPSIHDEDSYGGDIAPNPFFEHSRHRSRHPLNRSGLNSVEEDLTFDEDADESAWSIMTRIELLETLKSQQSRFAIERQEMLSALRQSREQAAQSSREWERLRAEDGWKTEQLNKAREEITWLSRLADTLELDKTRLEDRVHSMAKELRRVSVNHRKGTPKSQSAGLMRDMGPLSPSRGPNLARSAGIPKSSARSSEAASLSRLTSKSSYSPRTPSTAVHRTSYMSGDSVRTICPKGPTSKVPHGISPRAISNWRARESSVDESDAISAGRRQHRVKHRIALSQRSESDFHIPITASNLHSPRSNHHESFGSRSRSSRHPSSSRSVGLRRKHSDYQNSEAGSSEDGRHANTIIEERDDQVHRGGSSSSYSSRHGFQNADYSENDEVSDYHEDHTEFEEPLDYQDVVYAIDAHKGHSRNNSAESSAISPSSTVFADHQRNHRSRIGAYNRHSPNLSDNPRSRSSLISLQLRPEDELFLENYLDNDENLSDDDF